MMKPRWPDPRSKLSLWWSRNRWKVAFVQLLGGLFILVYVFSGVQGWYTTRLIAAAGRVEHTLHVRDAIKAILLDVAEIEAARRGYALYGEEELLADYRRSRDATAADVARLCALTADNAAQQASCARLRPTLALMAERSDRVAGGRGPTTLAASRQARAQAAVARRELAAMDAEELRLLTRRRRSVAGWERQARLGMLILMLRDSVAVLLLLGGVLAWVKRARPLVLVAEDDGRTLVLVGRQLRAAGLDVTYATTVPEALRRLDDRPDRVVLDLLLEGGDGKIVLREACKRGWCDRVVVVTGTADAAELDVVGDLSPRAVLVKPVDLAMLLEALGVNAPGVSWG